MRYITCTHLAEPVEISELDPFGVDDYAVRVVFRSGDRQWGEWLTTTASELAPFLFPKEIQR